MPGKVLEAQYECAYLQGYCKLHESPTLKRTAFARQGSLVRIQYRPLGKTPYSFMTLPDTHPEVALCARLSNTDHMTR